MAERRGGDVVLELLAQLRGTVEEAALLKKQADGAKAGPSVAPAKPAAAAAAAAGAIPKAGLRKLREDVFKLELLQRENRDTGEHVTELTEECHTQTAALSALERALENSAAAFSAREKDLLSTIERLRKTETGYRVVSMDMDNQARLCQRQQQQSSSLRAELLAQKEESEHLKGAVKTEQETNSKLEKERNELHRERGELKIALVQAEQRIIRSQGECRQLDGKLTRLQTRLNATEQQSKAHLREASAERDKSVKALSLAAALAEEKGAAISTIRALEQSLEEAKKVLASSSTLPSSLVAAESLQKKSGEDGSAVVAAAKRQKTEHSETTHAAFRDDTCSICHIASFGLMRVVCKSCSACVHSGCMKSVEASCPRCGCVNP